MFLIWKIIKILKISKFWNCSSIRYSAPIAILPIFILPFDINFIFYCSDTRKFGRSTFERSLIYKFEISAILKNERTFLRSASRSTFHVPSLTRPWKWTLIKVSLLHLFLFRIKFYKALSDFNANENNLWTARM